MTWLEINSTCHKCGEKIGNFPDSLFCDKCHKAIMAETKNRIAVLRDKIKESDNKESK